MNTGKNMYINIDSLMNDISASGKTQQEIREETDVNVSNLNRPERRLGANHNVVRIRQENLNSLCKYFHTLPERYITKKPEIPKTRRQVHETKKPDQEPTYDIGDRLEKMTEAIYAILMELQEIKSTDSKIVCVEAAEMLKISRNMAIMRERLDDIQSVTNQLK